jgi:putative ABC transport system permease protein
VKTRFRFPFPRADEIRRDISDEIEFHLAEATAELERKGLSPLEARAEARARLGDVTRLHRDLYRLDHRSVVRDRMRTALSELRSDLAFAARRIRRRPTLAIAITVTLAIGLGTSLTFAGAADAILLRPLPLHEPDRIVTLWRSPVDEPESRAGLAPGTAMDLVESSKSLSALAVAQPYSLQIERDGEPLEIGTWRVTDGYFAALRGAPVLGRLLEAPDFVAGAEATVVVTHEFWQRHLAGAPDVIDRFERLDEIPHRIVGVLPPEFPIEEGRQLYVPYRIAGTFRENRVADYWSAYARLAPGVSIDAARSELTGLVERSDARGPATARRRAIQAIPLADTVLGDMRGRLGLLALAAFLLLLMAAANASSLMIADTMGRQRELAVRASVGAGRERIMRQLLTESVLLALGAGAIGMLLGSWGLRLFREWAPRTVPRLAELQPDLRLVGIALLLTLVLAAIVGAASARIAATTDLATALKNSADAAGGSRGRRFRAVLVASQVALAVLLLSSGGLLLRSWIALSATDQGYSAAGVMGIENHIWGSYRTPAAQIAFADQLTARLEAVPGVVAAAVATDLPLAPAIGGEVAEVRPVGASAPTQLHGLTVSKGYFAALDLTLVEGRLFAAEDQASSEPVAIVSRSAARRLFGDGKAIDEYVELTAPGVPASRRRIIGIVADARYTSLEAAPDASFYAPHAQLPTGSLYFVTRHRGEAMASLPAVREAVREVMPGSALNEVVALGEVQRDAATPRRFALLLLLSFSGVALALTGVGLFGLLAQVVRLRERELGIRLALGAWPSHLRTLLLREGLRLAATGFAVGTITFLVVSGALRGLLYGVPARDPLTIIGVATLMLAVTALSCWWPATLATRVDPLKALSAT